MKLTNDLIEKAKELAEKLSDEYEYIGFRVQDVPFVLGNLDHLSHIWIDGEETDEELSGVCVTDVNSEAFKPMDNFEYFGEFAAIVVGNDALYGEDAGELIIRDAVVKYVF